MNINSPKTLMEKSFMNKSIRRAICFSFFTLLLSSENLLAQAPDLSGIMSVQGVNSEEMNSICIKFEAALVGDDESIVLRELNKYPGIKSISVRNAGEYIYIKYTNEISANQLLAVLDKINKRGHYLSAGVPVYYQKDQNIYFFR
jgi:inosine/xanthosine triphosphate pyrophosphatase family protein